LFFAKFLKLGKEEAKENDKVRKDIKLIEENFKEN